MNFDHPPTQVQLLTNIQEWAGQLERILPFLPLETVYDPVEAAREGRHAARLAALLERARAAQHPRDAVMQPMVGDAGLSAVRAWPPGLQVLHIYAIPQMTDELSEVLAAHHAAAPGLIAPVPRDRLHLTLARVDDATPADADALAAALTSGIASRMAAVGRWEPDQRLTHATAALERHGTLLTLDGAPGWWPPLAGQLMRAARDEIGRAHV
jgi:hypothetical protein